MQKRKSIYAIIPARAGSKGVTGKNIRLLGGFPLISYSIVLAKQCPAIDRIIVTTDAEEIAVLSMDYGAEAPFLRPKEISGDLSSDRQFVVHALQWFLENEGILPDYLVHLRPTTPLRDHHVVQDAVNAMISNEAATSLRSGHEAAESPFKWFVRDNEGYFRSLNPDDSSSATANQPRQIFPPVYIPDGYVDVLKTSYVLSASDIHGEKMIGYVSPWCCEVDTLEDLEYLEFCLTNRSHPLLDFLKANHSGKC